MGLVQVLNLPKPRRTAAADAAAAVVGTGASSATGDGTTGEAPDVGASPAPAPTPAPAPAPEVASEAVVPPGGTGATSGGGIIDAITGKTEFERVRAEIVVLQARLTSHAQAGKIGTQLRDIAAKIAAADAKAKADEWRDGTVLLEEARRLCEAGTRLADDWAEFAKLRASVAGAREALRGFLNATQLAPYDTAITGADNDVNTKSPPDFAAAKTKLKSINDAVAPALKAEVQQQRDKLTRVQAMSASVKAFAAKDIAEAAKLIAQSEAAANAASWAECIRTKNVGSRILGPLERLGARRTEYDTARAGAKTVIDAVRAVAALQPQAAMLDGELAACDRLASYETRKFDEALVAVAAVRQRAERWRGLGATATAYTTQRPLADAELAALDTHAAAAKVAPAREAARTLLNALTGRVPTLGTSPDPVAGWSAALTDLLRVRADLGVARKLADSLGPAAAAETAAANPKDLDALREAVKNLKADAVKARAAAHADAAKAPLDTADKRVAEAEAALGKANGAAAAKALAAGAAALAQARGIQAAHGQFANALVSSEAQLATLKALPDAKLLAPLIDPVAKALADAKAADAKHDGAAAMTALRRSDDAVAAVRRAEADLKKFRDAAAPLATSIAAIADAKQRDAFDKTLAAARKLADGLRFADAQSELKKLLAKVKEAELRAMTAANPADPKIRAKADELTQAGGGKIVDDMIAKLPDSADPRLLTALASGRFGTTFQTDPGASNANEIRSMRSICKMFAKVPGDIRGNKSITGVVHRNASLGGDHSPDSALITMQGRPGVSNQEFGANLVAPDPTDPTGTATVPQLGKVDKECQPANTDPVDFLDFAALHEVGHGVDDAKGVMAQNMTKSSFGGWKVYGASVKEIADVVGPHYSFYETPEQKKYVLDKIANQPAVAPPVPTTPGDWAARKRDFDNWHRLATAPNVYRRESDCKNITIQGRIYHEAYPREWVSYEAAARSKGLTGYQFRAPAEWFAELYAGYHTGKLGKSHPALDWLKKL